MPAADDLFRPTAAQPAPESTTPAAPAPPEDEGHDDQTSRRRPSGRVRHDEKMTVYVTADELFDLEHARLALRREHELAVDRGRLVREAVAIALADLEERGEDSDIVQRLKQA